jgi:uncharacterized protein
MTNRQQIIETLKRAKGSIFQNYPINKLGLFGSYARNQAVESSDIDILVEFSQPVGFEFIDLAAELEELLHHKVDLVSRKGIKTALWPYIEKDLIYV